MMSCIDPFVNVLRSTVAVSAGAGGGADHISILPYDRDLREGKAMDSRWTPYRPKYSFFVG